MKRKTPLTKRPPINLSATLYVVMRGVVLHPPRASMSQIRATMRAVQWVKVRRLRPLLDKLTRAGLIRKIEYNTATTSDDRWTLTGRRFRLTGQDRPRLEAYRQTREREQTAALGDTKARL